MICCKDISKNGRPYGFTSKANVHACKVKDVKCKDGIENIFKSTNGMRACMKSSNVQRLMEIGWAASQDIMKKDKMMEK